MLRYVKRTCVKDVPSFALVFLLQFYIQKEVERSIFGEHFGSSKNVKKIAIHPQSLIRHLGIIKNQKPQQTHNKQQFA